MSNAIVKRFESSINGLEQDFNKVLGKQDKLNFKREALFAVQALQKNSFLLTTCQNNPESLKNSILNVASIGISLNPAKNEAYLVPRDGQVCLDVSYRGMASLATESGSISCVQADVVYSNDTFEYQGKFKIPVHQKDPFSDDRGEKKGVYCVAIMPNGTVLVEVMSVAECFAIRDQTKIWKKSQAGPWKNHENEMIKKTVIKRAAKLWPNKPKSLDQAIHVLNKHEGIDLAENIEVREIDYSSRHELIDEIKACLNVLTKEMDNAGKMAYFKKYFPRANTLHQLINFDTKALTNSLEILKKEIGILKEKTKK